MKGMDFGSLISIFSQVMGATRSTWKTLGLLTYRVGLLLVWAIFALPGVIVNGPIFILAKLISRKKQRGQSQVHRATDPLMSRILCRGTRRIYRKDRRARCCCYMESSHLRRSSTFALWILRLHRYYNHLQNKRCSEMEDRHTIPNHDRSTFGRIFGAQVRRSWNGCFKVRKH
jgi:hypothetical protein